MTQSSANPRREPLIVDQGGERLAEAVCGHLGHAELLARDTSE
jgi:hypothetical protein